MEELEQSVGSQRFVAVGRELTKQFEEILRGSVAEIHERLRRRSELKGEFVIILAGCDYTE
jgi:16S rRNA (cytidine1402-2'-O)-methyltransferase